MFKSFFISYILLCGPWIFGSSTVEAKAQKSKRDKRTRSSNYVHEWIECPRVHGYNMQGDPVSEVAAKGDMHVLIFYASWCVPCQNQIQKIMDIEKEMTPRGITFTWLFAHDLQEDIRGFSKAHNLRNPVFATKDTVAGFHNPGLPAIYMCDRHGWLLNRYLKMSDADVLEFRSFLDKTSGY